MTTVYVCTYFGGETTYHDDAETAERRATRLVNQKRTDHAYVYPIDVEETA